MQEAWLTPAGDKQTNTRLSSLSFSLSLSNDKDTKSVRLQHGILLVRKLSINFIVFCCRVFYD